MVRKINKNKDIKFYKTVKSMTDNLLNESRYMSYIMRSQAKIPNMYQFFINEKPEVSVVIKPFCKFGTWVNCDISDLLFILKTEDDFSKIEDDIIYNRKPDSIKKDIYNIISDTYKDKMNLINLTDEEIIESLNVKNEHGYIKLETYDDIKIIGDIKYFDKEQLRDKALTKELNFYSKVILRKDMNNLMFYHNIYGSTKFIIF